MGSANSQNIDLYCHNTELTVIDREDPTFTLSGYVCTNAIGIKYKGKGMPNMHTHRAAQHAVDIQEQ